ncbi:MAG: imidazole glycerol phosphate synthase subunit HisH [Gammaproteobacteria bacterium]
MSRVAVVDSGANFASVRGALARCGADFELTHERAVLENASHVILPGVGNVADSWSRLEEFDLLDTIRSLTQPVLGICVGMQLMFEHCDEAGHDTLGIFSGRVSRMVPGAAQRVPHCGWNQLQVHDTSPLTAQLSEQRDAYVYFVHSYSAPVTDQTLAICTHGLEFSAAARRDNFYGVQFHPERSSKAGEAWLKAFLSL